MTARKTTSKALPKGLTPEQAALASKLTHLQRMTVIYMTSGMSKRAAYTKAGGKAKGKSADNSIGKMMEKDGVRAFYDSLVAKAASTAVMTRQEALETLSKIARTTVKDVARFRKAQIGMDEDGKPVYQTVWELKDDGDIEDAHAAAISELSAGRDGLKFKLHSQTGAIKQLSDLEGWEAPKKIEHAGGIKLDAEVTAPEIAEALTGLLKNL